ncbi:hypothetical protein OUZ56_017399 [Daphnia magna]|uniref:Uncharacterized protein n=1 Tax=Daphnia magna TaxID=35525 RepID=A0ABR0ASS2_9CRUS|nr:hypothetical protein OUZ56_017399 [Daphnia magna]
MARITITNNEIMTLPSLSSSTHVVSACGGTKLRPLSQPSYSPQLPASDGQPLRPLSHHSFIHVVSACGGTKLRPLSQHSYSPLLPATSPPLRPLSHPRLIYDSSINCRKCSPDEALEIEEQPDNTVLAQKTTCFISNRKM